MNKAKKALSAFLAAVMVFTLIPGSVFSYESRKDGWTQSAIEANVPKWNVDTSATVRTIRFAASQGSYAVVNSNNTVVPVTTNGEGVPIADSSAPYGSLSYAGGSTTAVKPTVSFVLTGDAATVESAQVCLSQEAGAGSGVPVAYSEGIEDGEHIIGLKYSKITNKIEDAGNSKKKLTIVWEVGAPDNGTGISRELVIGKDIVFKIPFYVNGDEKLVYTDYAYSYGLDIYRAPGYIIGQYSEHAGLHANYYLYHYTALFCGNSIAESSSSSDLSYLNYGYSGTGESYVIQKKIGDNITGKCLEGVINATTDTSKFFVKDTTAGSLKRTVDNTTDTIVKIWNGSTNLINTYVYVDRSRETFQSNTAGKTNLNMRISSFQAASKGEYTKTQGLFDVRIHSDHYTEDDATKNSNTSGIKKYLDKWPDKTASGFSTSFTGKLLSNGGITPEDLENSHQIAGFTADSSNLNEGSTGEVKFTIRTISAGEKKNFERDAYCLNYFPVTVQVYDTTNLRNLYYGISTGKNLSGGTTYTFSNNSGSTQTGTFNDVYPGSVFYGVGNTGGVSQTTWNTFVDAYKAAGKIIAKFRTSQADVDSAYTALARAYNALGTPKKYKVTIRHYKAKAIGNTNNYEPDTNVKLLEDEFRNASAGDSYKVSAQKLEGGVYKGGIDGYSVVAVYVGNDKQNALDNCSFVVKGDTTVTFCYKPIGYDVAVYKETPDEPIPAHNSYELAYGENFLTGQYITDLNGKYEHHAVEGFYTDVTHTTPLPSTMPKLTGSTTYNIYTKWKPKDVMLDITAVYSDDDKLPEAITDTEIGASTPEIDPDDDALLRRVTFNLPTVKAFNAAHTISGYQFAGFYTDYHWDDELGQNVFEGPVSETTDFYYSDGLIVDNGETYDTIQLYAKFVNVQNTIYIEPNGGTLQGYPSIVTFDIHKAVSAPAYPTQISRPGYRLSGWKDQNGDDIGSWNNNAPYFPTNSEGFIAIAQWEQKEVSICFDVNNDSAENADYNSKNTEVGPDNNDYFAIVTGNADDDIPDLKLWSYTNPEGITVKQKVPASVNKPRQFGYICNSWVDETGEKFDFSKFPATDEPVVVYANWVPNDIDSYITLDTYEKVSGNLVKVDDGANVAQKGDVVTVRVSVATNFYTGTARYVFMYDKNFYTPYIPSDDEALPATTIDYVTWNPDNGFVKSFGAKASRNIDDSQPFDMWPEELRTPENQAKYNLTIVTIDPADDDYTKQTQKISGDEWLLELRYKIKDNATGSGEIFMDNSWTRNEENPVGFMYMTYSDKARTFYTAQSNMVTPNLDFARSTVQLKNNNTKQKYSLRAQLSKDVTVVRDSKSNITENVVDSTIKFGTTEHSVAISDNKIYIDYNGAEGTEIYSFPEIEREGYTALKYWAKTGSGITATTVKNWSDADWASKISTGDVWIAGYYATAAQAGKTYEPIWVPNEYRVYFWNGQEPAFSENNYYTYNIDEYIYSPGEATKQNYEFAAWINNATGQRYTTAQIASSDDNIRNIGICKGEENYYADFIGAPFSFQVKAKKSDDSAISGKVTISEDQIKAIVENTEKYTGLSEYSRVGMRYVVAKEIPTQRAENTNYLLMEDLKTFLEDTSQTLFDEQYTIDYEGESNNGVCALTASGSELISASSKKPSILTLYAKAAQVQVTLKPGEGAFDPATPGYNAENGTVKVSFDKNSTVDTSSFPKPTRNGYDFTGWNVSGTTWTKDTEVTANYILKKLKVVYLDQNGAVFSTPTTTKNVNSSFDPVAHGGTPTWDAGHEFQGYRIAEYDSTSGKYVFSSTYTDTYNASKQLRFTPEMDGTAYKTEGNECKAYLMASFEAITNEGYTVEYYGEKADGTYELLSSDTTKTGRVGKEVTAEAIDIENYTYNATRTGTENKGTVTETPKLVLKVYYDRVTVPYSIVFRYDTYVSGIKQEAIADGYEVANAKWGTKVTINPNNYPDRFRTGYHLKSETPFEYTVKKDGEAYVDFALNTHKITYLSEDGKEQYAELPYDYSQPVPTYVSLYGEPVKTGYSFNNWDLGEPSVMPDSDVTLKAVFGIASYNVNLWKNEEMGESDFIRSIPVEFGKKITEPDDVPELEGNTFNYWYKQGAANEFDFNKETMPAADLNLIAKFTPNDYTITFHNEESTETKTLTYVYGTPTGLADDSTRPGTDKYGQTYGSDPTKTGSNFSGWYTNVNPTVGVKYTFGNMPAKNVDVYAVFDLKEAYLTLLNEDGTTYTTLSGKFGEKVNAPVNLTKVGHYFAGWFNDLNEAIPDTFPEANAEYTAVFAPETYRIHFVVDDVDDATGITDIDVKYNQEFGININLPDSATEGFSNKGQTFVAWCKDVNLAQEIKDGDTVWDAGDNNAVINLFPKWSTNSYTVKIDTSNAGAAGSAGTPVSYEYGKTVEITSADVPVKTGHDFDHWELTIASGESLDADLTKLELTFNMPASDIVLKAVYSEHLYTSVVFVKPADADKQLDPTKCVPDADNAAFYTFTKNYEDIKKSGVKFGETIVLPENEPTVEFFKFIGWFTADGTQVGADLTMPALTEGETLYLYPKYERITVSLQQDDGSIVKLESNSNAKLVKDPATGDILTTKEGNTPVYYIKDFDEFSTKQDISGQLNVVGNGSLRITTYYEYRHEVYNIDVCGTGSKIEVVDNATDEVVEIYYVVIFGDVNGDGVANATDASYIRTMENDDNADDLVTEMYQTIAADVWQQQGDADFTINSKDRMTILALQTGSKNYDRVTGTLI